MFKLLMSDKEILTWFLNRILKTNIKNYYFIDRKNNKEITEEYIIDLIEKELKNANIKVRKKTVDILVKTNKKLIGIEYNNTFNKEIKKRNFAYMANIYSNALKTGKKYEEQPMCIQINLCKKIPTNINDKYKIVEKKYNQSFIDNLIFLVFDVDKYKKILYNGNKKLIKKYLHLIMLECTQEELEILKEYDEIMKKICNLVDKYNDDDQIYSFMTSQEDYDKLNYSILESSKKKAIKEGIKEGYKKKTIEIATKLLKEKIPLDIISKTTGCSQEYLKKIKV